jgi:thiamine kinase-like enzyme
MTAGAATTAGAGMTAGAATTAGAARTDPLAPELEARLDEVPGFAGRPRTVETLAGGLTNVNLKVTTPDGCFVARLSNDHGDLLAIDREAEYRNSLAAAESGMAPAVVDYLPGRGVLVVAWVDGTTYEPADVREPANLPRLADACRTLHAGPAFANDFDMFRIHRGYLTLVQDRGFRLPDRFVDFQPQVERMEAALAVHPNPPRPCNNDLLAANIIDAGDRLWLIDWEYAGNGDPAFELGNVWSESNLSLEQLEELVTRYYGEPRPDQVARARLLGVMSKYGWTLWGSIQDSISDLDFDFWGWAMEKYDRAVEEFDGPDFETLLDTVAAGPR